MMDYDDLVARLRSGCDANTAFLHCYEAADVITTLRERVGELARTLNDHLLSEAAETMRADRAESDLAAAREVLLVAGNEINGAKCPRPANTRPDDATSDDCAREWNECGCGRNDLLHRIDAFLAGKGRE